MPPLLHMPSLYTVVIAAAAAAGLYIPCAHSFSINPPASVLQQRFRTAAAAAGLLKNRKQEYYNSSTSSTSLFLETEKAACASRDILAALQTRTGGDLEVDFYDPTTHLCSEGVWHNALAGIASLYNQQQESAQQIAKALHDYSWDGTSFQRRAWSGSWDHSRLDDSSCSPPAQANYYRKSEEHRCVQHGMALIFWSELAVTDADVVVREQQQVIAAAFIKEFWNDGEKLWTTISKTQGGGNTLRPSASAAKQTVVDDDTPGSYYRAVDQAIAVLALLAHIQVLETNGNNAAGIKDLMRIVQLTCDRLLAPTNQGGFGYGGNVNDSRSYIGLTRNRNFWHDGWVLLAIATCARRQQYTWPPTDSSDGQQLQTMLDGLIGLYGHDDLSSGSSFDGTLWHWPKKLKDSDSNVRYCGDNALLYAISRTIYYSQDSSSTEPDTDGFWKFIGKLRDNKGGLSSVADAYPQVRLHPNTELAALLVWPK